MRSVLVFPLLVFAAAASANDVLAGVSMAGSVPEPTSIAALAVGTMGLLRRYKKA